jgi:hypothetical protein
MDNLATTNRLLIASGFISVGIALAVIYLTVIVHYGTQPQFISRASEKYRFY